MTMLISGAVLGMCIAVVVGGLFFFYYIEKGEFKWTD